MLYVAKAKRNVYCTGMGKKRQKIIRNSSPLALKDFYADFIKRCGISPEQEQLRHLWDNWDMVCPEDIYGLAKPYACKGKILCIGAETPLDLQEIRMYYTELLERINVFLLAYGLENYFEKLEFSLLRGKKSLLERQGLPEHFVREFPKRPETYGKKVDFHGIKSLERCYEAYCNCLKNEEKIIKKN